MIDPLRAGHEVSYFPGEVNLRGADVLVINKVRRASPKNVESVARTAAEANPRAVILRTRSAVSVDGDPEAVRGKRVLCIEDGPTLTHGGMAFGAGQVAAEKFGAAEVVDPRSFAVGSIREALDANLHIEKALPAMGYYPQQVADLEQSVRAADCDLVLIGTPFDLGRKLNVDKPTMRVRYAIEDAPVEPGSPTLAETVLDRLRQNRENVA